MKNIYILFICLFTLQFAVAQSIVTYPSPKKGFTKVSDKYVINIIQNGKKTSSFVYKVKAEGVGKEYGQMPGKRFHFTNFSFNGPVTIEVIKLHSKAKRCYVRPGRLGLGNYNTIPLADGSKKIVFKLKQAKKIAVEFSDDYSFNDALMIFANELEAATDVPSGSKNKIYYAKEGDDFSRIGFEYNTVYFRPGVYKIGKWTIPAAIEQVYIAGGAYVSGYLERLVGNKIKINGRGILTSDGYPFHYPGNAGDNDNKNWHQAIYLARGVGHIIEGITILEPSSFTIESNGGNVLIKNVKIHGFRYNNDGMTITGNANKIEDCFISTNDDAIIIYGSNLIVTKCVFWQLQGSILQLGWRPHSFSNVTIADCDILHDNAAYSDGNVGFINAMNYSPSKKTAIVKDFNVSNIYFDTPILRFLDIRGDRNYSIKAAIKATVANPSKVWVYRNFNFNNIHFSQRGVKAPLIFLHGFNDEHPISNFVFRNIFINNRKVGDEWWQKNDFLDTKNTVEIETY